MSDEIKKYLDSANFKFKDIDENGVEKELTLSETIEKLIEDNKRLVDYITNLRQVKEDYKSRVEKAVEYIKHIDKYEETLNDDTRVYMVQDVEVEEIESILKGEDNES